MKKIFINTIIFTILFFCIPFLVSAEEFDAVISGNTVRIRSGAGTENTALYTVNAGTSIKVIDKTLYPGTGCSDKWYRIKYKNETAYVCSTYVRFVDNSFDGINVADWTARVNANNVAVRTGAGTKYSSLTTLSLGVNVKILSKVSASNSGCSTNEWYKIEYYNGQVGYMCSKYVTKKESVTSSDAEYEAELRAAGFDDTYIPYLVYLHKKYPNWVFIAKDTQSLFSVAVSSEEGKNYMQTTNNNYRTSSTPAEGSSWFKVNTGVIAFYMDPRNFLTEERIFMFEKLDYDSKFDDKYPGMIKAIFGSGKLSDDKYTIPIFNAGKTNKISPVHIASRIKQEVTANGSDSTNGCEFTFKGKTYSGYYNFFNIGAYEQTIDGVRYGAITRGLAYAAKLIDRSGSVWDNIQTSIVEGSSFLANGYITKGQGTLYYQKFNVNPDAYYSNYTHQYMTNIQAPATEGNSTYNSYKSSNILSEPIIFEIPVYRNMPLYTSLPASGDSNNYLKTLEVENYEISPEFDEDVLTYEAIIPNTINEVTINATTQSSKASVSGIGTIELNEEDTDITITVTSETHEERKYIVTIKKVAVDENGNGEINNNDNNNDNLNNDDNNQDDELDNNQGTDNNNNQEGNDSNQGTDNNNNQEGNGSNQGTDNNNDNQEGNGSNQGTDNNNNQEGNDSNQGTDNNNNQEGNGSNQGTDNNNNQEGNDSNQGTDNNNDDTTNTNNNDDNGQTNNDTDETNNIDVNTILNQSSISINNTNITNVKYNTSASTIQNKLISMGAISVNIKSASGIVLVGSSQITTGSSLLVCAPNEEKTFTFVISGDTSGDGSITILDLLQVQKHLKGDKKLTGDYLKAADTSLDGNVTILDLLQIQKHLKGDKKL